MCFIIHGLYGGDEWRSNVGVAVSDSPLGPFIDKGCLIDSKVIGVQNSIDQFFYEDNGKNICFGEVFGYLCYRTHG